MPTFTTFAKVVSGTFTGSKMVTKKDEPDTSKCKKKKVDTTSTTSYDTTSYDTT